MPKNDNCCMTADLETENEALRQEVAELRAMLVSDLVFPGYSPQQSIVLNHLLKVRFTTPDNLVRLLINPRSYAERDDANIVRVNICHLKKKLEPLGITIQKPAKHIYQLDEANKQRVRELAL